MSPDAVNKNKTQQSFTSLQTCPDAAVETVSMETVQADDPLQFPFHLHVISAHFHPL